MNTFLWKDNGEARFSSLVKSYMAGTGGRLVPLQTDAIARARAPTRATGIGYTSASHNNTHGPALDRHG
jgi:hypothetical protein